MTDEILVTSIVAVIFLGLLPYDIYTGESAAIISMDGILGVVFLCLFVHLLYKLR